MSSLAISIEISGRVQGVFFRASTKEVCERLGIHGWVKNLPTGNVLIHAQGSDAQLNELKAWCHEGSPLSKVDAVKVETAAPISQNKFEIRR